MKNLRSKFPFFSNTSYAYLDSAATSQKPKSVIDTMRDFYERENASVHRGIYLLSEEATDRFEKVREKVAKWLNAKSYDIIFTSGTTGAINLVADSVKNSCNKSDKILLTRCEHHANFLPWQRIAKLAFLPFDKEKILVSPDASFDGIRLAAVTGFSNVLGDVWDGKLSEFVSNARAAGVQVLIDGAQLVAHEQVDLEALQPDFFAFSGHK
ncbi:aminotransferase class V-fold PLP-dependent enzyme, partial [bacterium]|nr:aminotransferase class V-fold PLP-dependent enzyme [bacterium]